MRELQNKSIAYNRLFFLDLIHSLTVVPSHTSASHAAQYSKAKQSPKDHTKDRTHNQQKEERRRYYSRCISTGYAQWQVKEDIDFRYLFFVLLILYLFAFLLPNRLHPPSCHHHKARFFFDTEVVFSKSADISCSRRIVLRTYRTT